MKKYLVMSIIALLCVCTAAQATLIPVTGSETALTFEVGGVVKVVSEVKQDDVSGLYYYYYTVNDPSVVTGLNVSILPGAVIDEVVDAGFGVDSFGDFYYWDSKFSGATSGISSVYAGIVSSSSDAKVFVFTSYDAPTTVNAGLTGDLGNDASGYNMTVYTPVPEPATIGILAIGALVSMRRRKA